MMRVRVAELKDHLSEHLRRVEAGARIEVTDRARPIAMIVPIEGGLEMDPPATPFSAIRDKRYASPRWKRSSLEMLLEERGQR